MAEKLLPKVFRKAPPYIVSYDYFDYSNGTGYDIYYGAKGSNGEYITSTIAVMYSEEPHTAIAEEVNMPVTYGNAKIDVDFDILFNIPRDIKGDILLNVPVGIVGKDGGSTGSWVWYVNGIAYHYDGSTETQIGTGASEEFRSQTLADNEVDTANKVMLVKMNVPSVQHFKKGETLRITVQLFARTYGTSGNERDGIVGIGHDPANKNDYAWKYAGSTVKQQIILDGNVTQLSIHVPFRIQT